MLFMGGSVNNGEQTPLFTRDDKGLGRISMPTVTAILSARQHSVIDIDPLHSSSSQDFPLKHIALEACYSITKTDFSPWQKTTLPLHWTFLHLAWM